MMLRGEEIINITKGKFISGDPDVVFTGISTDSRHIEAGDLFIALSGEQYNGHAFAAEAIARGALGVLVMEKLNIP